MKVLQINSVCGIGSTGKIAANLSNILSKYGHESYIAYGCGNSNENNSYKIQNNLGLKYSILQTRIFGKHGFYNKKSTNKMIRWIDKINPDIIHLHNIHGHYVNIELLFNHIKEREIPIVWTLHDCWSFTGHCSHFEYIKCNKWIDGCYSCKELKSYPKSLIFDRSKESYNDKRRIFSGVKNLTIVTPSEWLANLVNKSFLKEYPVKVINNGIDLNLFKPTKNNFIEKYNLKGKKIILGVSMGFGERKGYKYFLELAKLLNSNYQIVLIGISEEQKRTLPKNITGILKTESAVELAEIYTAADVFVNPTLEDTFPTVNLEALACGTPIITFETGGSTECITNDIGIVVKKGDIEGLFRAIIDITKYGKKNYEKNCINHASKYDKEKRYIDYIELYKLVNEDR